MTTARFVVGIDLGTTNSAMAFVDTAAAEPSIATFAVPQLVAPGAVEARPTLPSFLYLPAPAELRPESLALPWSAAAAPVGANGLTIPAGASPTAHPAGAGSAAAHPAGDDPAAAAPYVVGELARSHGWQVPSRLVSSAKSWLCHPGVDRTAAILPWHGRAEVPPDLARVSPVTASARYLAHLRAAWDHAHPEAPLAEQDVLLTVPASFDAVARELTVRAAAAAGLAHVTLLEEPQAAFYSWLGQAGDRWRSELAVGDVVLVCDLGGGTTDFSLIAVEDAGGNLGLERVAVGDHILLGGDNMDLALAYTVQTRLAADGHKLDHWQLTSLVHSCRQAKEQLLSGEGREAAPVVVLGRGSRVIGGSIKSELLRADVERVLVDGFFPVVGLDERVRAERRAGLRELGLPFAADAAVTRHLAQFVSQLMGAARGPTAVLFNGGVMKGRPLRQRILETLDGWSDSPESDLKVLSGTDLDLAVAHGAAYYGMVRRGKGVRIRGGTARAYYIGIETSMPAVPGMVPPLKALCVAPFGMEEGTEAEVTEEELGLVIGEPAEFRFLASSTRREDEVGTLVDDVAELQELAPVSTVLGDANASDAGQLVPVTLRSRVTEIGTLELYCVERPAAAAPGGAAATIPASGRRWKLEYNVREHD